MFLLVQSPRISLDSNAPDTLIKTLINTHQATLLKNSDGNASLHIQGVKAPVIIGLKDDEQFNTLQSAWAKAANSNINNAPTTFSFKEWDQNGPRHIRSKGGVLTPTAGIVLAAEWRGTDYDAVGVDRPVELHTASAGTFTIPNIDAITDKIPTGRLLTLG